MTITYHDDLIQGSEEWHNARCGLLTASEMKLILTPTLKIANNDKTRAHAWELAAQRITNYVEPTYIGDAMLRGHDDEILARDLYGERIEPVTETGFVTNDGLGVTLGCSPDGLVGETGMIEVKSRVQKYQIQTIVENYRDGSAPSEFMMQVQTAMLVCGREWCDLVSYSGGLPMWPIRIHADAEIQAAIIEAATAFESTIQEIMFDYRAAIGGASLVIETDRTVEEEMIV